MENQKDQAQYHHEKALFQWMAPEYIQYEKGQTWYVVAGIFAMGFIAYGLTLGSPLLSIVILILSAVYFLEHQKKPRNLKIIISELGVKIEDKFYPFGSLKGFWLVYDPPHVTTLHFKTINRVMPELTIQLGNIDPAPIRNYLARQLPEEEGKTEGFLNMLIRLLRL